MISPKIFKTSGNYSILGYSVIMKKKLPKSFIRKMSDESKKVFLTNGIDTGQRTIGKIFQGKPIKADILEAKKTLEWSMDNNKILKVLTI